MKERMKEFREFARAKAVKIMVAAPTAMTLMMAAANAEEPAVSTDTTAVTTAFTTGFQTIVNNGISMVSAMVPVALGLAGVIFLVKKGMSWFKSVAK